MNLGLADKIALVTGSSRGLGLASATALVAEGCRVAMCARGEGRLSEAAGGLSLPPLAERALIGLDILAVSTSGTGAPGSDLTVTIRL